MDGRAEGSEIAALLESWGTTPAIARDRHLDVLAANAAALALCSAYRPGTNLARTVFLDDAADMDSVWWRTISSAVIAMLHDSLDQHEEDRGFVDLVGELAARSPGFGRLWSDPDPEVPHRGEVRFPGSPAGDLVMAYQELRMPVGSEVVILLFRPADPSSARGYERFLRRSARRRV